jgi:Arc/MetJ family transcription regulator
MSKANYDLPDDKLQKVVRASGAESKREAIIIALDDYLAKKKAEALLKAYGKLPLSWTKSSLRKYRG